VADLLVHVALRISELPVHGGDLRGSGPRSFSSRR